MTKRAFGFRARSLILGVFLIAASAFGEHACGSDGLRQDRPPDAYACGGSLEKAVWDHWEHWGKPYAVTQLLGQRLSVQRDTYALYDLEITFHNLLAMAQRCRRFDRQLEMARLVKTAFSALGPLPGWTEGVAWVCRGGSICNRKARTLDSEVTLNSVQFLAFAGSLALSMESSQASRDGGDFAAEAAGVMLQHLERWNDSAARSALLKRVQATVGDVRDGSSALFLSDKDLWTIAVYADLAGILQKRPLIRGDLGLSSARLRALAEHAALILELLDARTSTVVGVDSGGKAVRLAEIDRGFWRRYVDNRYAGYTLAAPPVRCIKDLDNPTQQKVEVLVDAANVPRVMDVGWDISHARRFVHVFDALERSRGALVAVLGLSDKKIPSPETVAALARQLRFRVWNQDADHPLFTNYYSGVNGWYRVAYDNGTGLCRAGYAPFGLSISFPTGGYATWNRFEPVLGVLARRIHAMTVSSGERERAFVEKYYSYLSGSADPRTRALNELMFWPTLIGT